MVGISLLTLVPGVVGGSERYARELCRALSRVGELEYRVFVPRIAADAGETAAQLPRVPFRAADDPRDEREKADADEHAGELTEP